HHSVAALLGARPDDRALSPFPYTPLFRSLLASRGLVPGGDVSVVRCDNSSVTRVPHSPRWICGAWPLRPPSVTSRRRSADGAARARKSTRLNSSHVSSSDAVLCWKHETAA